MMPEREREQTVDFAKQYYSYLAHRSRLSFRAIEKIVSSFAISLAYRPKNTFCPDAIMIGLCALKVISPEIYVRAKSGENIFPALREPLCLGSPPDDQDQHVVQYMGKVWRYFTDAALREDDPEFREFAASRLNFNMERLNAVGFVARNIVDRLSA